MRESLNQAMEMAKRMGYVFLATADSMATPHMSIVQPISLDNQDRLKLMGWICQYTLNNLEENPKVAVIIWDAVKDTGFQLVGTMENMQQVAMLDGYAPGLEEKKHFPQIEWEILVRVEHILNFQKVPHIDVEV